MESFDYFVIARVIHIAAVVYWIGGVAFVTTVLIPSIKANKNPNVRLEQFEQLEGRFAKQAKVSTTLAMLSGFYMAHYLNAWDRYLDSSFWWMHLMTLVWFVFALVLFVLEPLVLHEKFKEWATKDSQKSFNRLHTMHIVLLSISTIAIVGAMAGSHGIAF